MLRFSFGSQSTASENSHCRWWLGSSLAATFSTIPRSGNSKRTRMPVARSSGPDFSSASSSESTSSRSSRNSVAELLRLRVAVTVPMRAGVYSHILGEHTGRMGRLGGPRVRVGHPAAPRLRERRAALDQVLVQLLLDRLPHLLRDVEQEPLIVGGVG